MLRATFITILLACGAVQAADPPPDVIDFFRTVTRALAEAHPDDPRFPTNASAFMDHFDPRMKGYGELRGYVEDLVSRAQIGSAVEFVTDEVDKQDANKRTLDLDWVLEIGDNAPRRKLLKCVIEKHGKKWKITALEPVDFFKY